jgi:hypothetical protein
MGSELLRDGDDEVVVAVAMAGQKKGGKEKRGRGDKRRGGRGIGAVDTHH